MIRSVFISLLHVYTLQSLDRYTTALLL